MTREPAPSQESSSLNVNTLGRSLPKPPRRLLGVFRVLRCGISQIAGGTVGPDGVAVPLRLTQTVLAALVALKRPTVSAALGALERGGRVTRTGSGWLLRGSPPGELQLVT
jgi:CRP-like cAMP-binding protein